MFTRLRLPRLQGQDAISRWLSDYLLSLERKGALAITEATIDGTPIGSTDPDAGTFTTLTATTLLAPHKTTHQSGGSDAIKLDDLAAPDDNTDLNASTSAHGLLRKLSNVSTEFLNGQGNWATPPSAAGGSYTAFTKDLGAARSSGTFDITGLSGLTAEKVVSVVQTAAQISSKGNARDEAEMDQIQVTGYVVDTTTIRAYWQAPSVVVGTYAFAYQVSG